jgi:cleavage stimulation factor subunit 3
MMQNEDTKKAEAAFSRVLLQVPHVRCWSLYIDYIRRMNNLATDQSGNARSTINSAFEFTLKHVGQDPGSLQTWQDYINFVKSMPGNISGEGWQDKQKVDACRKAYRQALSIPLPNLLQLWSEYTNFEITASRVNVSSACFSNFFCFCFLFCFYFFFLRFSRLPVSRSKAQVSSRADKGVGKEVPE